MVIVKRSQSIDYVVERDGFVRARRQAKLRGVLDCTGV
jgi:hypothetical protein